MKKAHTIEYNKKHTIFNGMDIEFYDAKHLPGSLGILLNAKINHYEKFCKFNRLKYGFYSKNMLSFNKYYMYH